MAANSSEADISGPETFLTLLILKALPLVCGMPGCSTLCVVEFVKRDHCRNPHKKFHSILPLSVTVSALHMIKKGWCAGVMLMLAGAAQPKSCALIYLMFPYMQR